MKCPVDNETLVITERSGVEIDYCPKCRGVWLDRGELDKIIDRAAVSSPREERPNTDRFQGNTDTRSRDDDDRRDYKPKRRESFLIDLFDF